MTGPLGVVGSVPLAVLERAGFPESVHQGAAVVVAPDGTVSAEVGDGSAAIYARSALKPLQTVAALRAGARLDAQGLAIVSSSHAGTARHIEAVRAVLSLHDVDESSLRTPEALPSAAWTGARIRPSRIAMNCSGNHAGMLAAASAGGWSVGEYLLPDHPVHALAEEVLLEYGGVAPTDRAVDGCGGPVWALPLRALARGYGRLGRDHPELVAAVRSDPELIEGAGMLTTRAIEVTGVFGKSGAEGIWCATTPDGAAVAVKVLDGSGRAASGVAIALLSRAGFLPAEAADAYLAEPAFAVLGGGIEVGRIRVIA